MRLGAWLMLIARGTFVKQLVVAAEPLFAAHVQEAEKFLASSPHRLLWAGTDSGLREVHRLIGRSRF